MLDVFYYKLMNIEVLFKEEEERWMGKKASESNSYDYSFKLLVANNQFACIYYKCNHYILGKKNPKDFARTYLYSPVSRQKIL